MQPWTHTQLKDAINTLQETDLVGFIYKNDEPYITQFPGKTHVKPFKGQKVWHTDVLLAGLMRNNHGFFSPTHARQTINELLGEAHFGRRKGDVQKYYVKGVENQRPHIIGFRVHEAHKQDNNYQMSLDEQDVEHLLAPKHNYFL